MKEYYVSTKGSDSHAGTRQHPFATLARAQEAVRDALAQADGRPGNIDVVLEPGIYRLAETLVFGPADGAGDSDARIRWRAESAGTVQLTGAIPLTDWERLANEPAHLHPEARGHVWCVQLPLGIEPRALFSRDGHIPRARGPGFTPLADELMKRAKWSWNHISADEEYLHLRCPPHAVDAWPDVDETELVVIPSRQWVMNILPIAAVEHPDIIRLHRSSTYPLGPLKDDGYTQTCWIENTLAHLRPGTWVFHRRHRQLFYCPPDKGQPEPGLEAASLTEYIRVAGRLDQPAQPDTPVRGLVFEGLTFTNSNRFAWQGQTGHGLQHDWECHDAPSCMVRFRGAEACRVESCRFEHGASGGMRLDLLAQRNAITNNVFHNLGGIGILLAGYGPGLKYVNRENEVTGNHIHHIGLSYWHSPGLFIWQSGANRIADNHIHDVPYTGLVCSGRIALTRNARSESARTIRWDEVDTLLGNTYQQPPWYHGWLVDWWKREPLLHARENLIEYNHIHDVTQVLGDGNGIYISGAGGGNIVRFNAVGPCPSTHIRQGIRCDDDQHQTVLHGNLVCAIGGWGIAIASKGINRITNNVMALSTTASIKRGMLSLETGPQWRAVIRDNVLLTYDTRQPFVGQIRIHGQGRRALLLDTDCDGNWYWSLNDPAAGDTMLADVRSFGLEQNGQAVDPGFVAPEQYDYRLRPDAPLKNSSFIPLPLDRMLKRPFNATLPA